MIQFSTTDIEALAPAQQAVWQGMLNAMNGFSESGERSTFTIKADPVHGSVQYTLAGKGCFLQLKAHASTRGS